MNSLFIILIIVIMSIIILGIILRGIILGIIVPQDNKKQKIKLDKPQAKIINTPEFIIYIP
jgi:hypothetical protein